MIAIALFAISFGEKFLQIPIRQSEAEIPANRQQDHLRREPEAGEHRQFTDDRKAKASHHETLAAHT